MTEEKAGEAAPEHASALNVVTSPVASPTVFADGCLYAATSGETIRLSFVETILEPLDVNPGSPKIRHVGTLVLPTQGFAATLAYLNKRAKDFGLEIPDVE